MNFRESLENLKEGKFVLIHDSSEREDETDMVILAEKVRPSDVARMRNDAGGLICTGIPPKAAEEIGLPFLSDIYRSSTGDYKILDSAEANDLPYDERSSFSIYVNHRDTFTGITDKDRALTIRELGKISSRAITGLPENEFGKKFRTPGHVPILRAEKGLLEEREGHTELSIALSEMAGGSPATVVCEMLDSATGEALTEDKAKAYSENNELPFLEGEEIKKRYEDYIQKEER